MIINMKFETRPTKLSWRQMAWRKFYIIIQIMHRLGGGEKRRRWDRELDITVSGMTDDRTTIKINSLFKMRLFALRSEGVRLKSALTRVAHFSNEK